MDNPALWLCIACIVLSLLFSVNNYTLRNMTASQLGAVLRERHRERSGKWACDDVHGLFLTTACMRFVAIIGVILCITYGVMHSQCFSTVASSPNNVLLWQLFLSLLISVLTITVFCIGIPAAWSTHGGEGLLLKSLPMLRICYLLLWPVLRLLKLFEKLFGVFHPEEPEETAKELELDIMSAVDEGAKEGLLGRDERGMIKRLIDFHDTQASNIMTPRTEIVAVDADADLEEIERLTATEGHSRIPVYEESLDRIVGMLYVKDVLLHLANGKQSFDIRTIMRQAIFVPETKRIADLLRELKAKKVHIAVVLDEYGGTSGLVSIEDILEEIVGEIFDEYEQPTAEPIVRLDEHTLELDARVRIEQLADEFNIELSNNQDVDTVGGLVFSLLGYVPKEGQEVDYGQLHFTVLDAERRKINRLKVHILTPPDGQEYEED